MSCRELETLFISGAPGAEREAHARSCLECRRLSRDIEEAAALAAALKAPAWSPLLRESLLAIPRQTVSCEAADALSASALEGEIAPADEKRFRSHLSRCAACTEAAGALFAIREMAAPEPPAWLATRLKAVRPEKKRSPWRKLFSGRAVVVYAYAAAIAVMLLGLNPTAMVRKTGFARLGESTRIAVTAAQSSLSDRLGALQEKALRVAAAWKGRISGYGRAAVSNAISLVLRPEPKKAPNRQRLGKEGGAATVSEGLLLVRDAKREPFRARFRV